MTTLVLANARVLTPGGFLPRASVSIARGRISSITPEPPTDADPIDLDGQTLLPGFIDTQVNGGGGVLFNDDPSVRGIETIAAAHRCFGTTGLLPTLISDDLATIACALDAVDEAIEQQVPGILGAHIEGPFLNSARRGIHSAAKLRKLDDEAIALLTRPRRGKLLLTLAPELVSAEQITELVARGVIVSAGHSDATYEEAQRGIAAGITGYTHLFNAMSPLQNRAPGLVGAALDHDAGIAGIIADGHHVHPAALRIALRAKSVAGLMLVTDAMPPVGTGDRVFMLGGKEIRLAHGMLRDADGTLAGSALTMADAVGNICRLAGISLDQAARMAAEVPARFLGLDSERGAIRPGMIADMVALDGEMTVTHSWIEGA